MFLLVYTGWSKALQLCQKARLVNSAWSRKWKSR